MPILRPEPPSTNYQFSLIECGPSSNTGLHLLYAVVRIRRQRPARGGDMATAGTELHFSGTQEWGPGAGAAQLRWVIAEWKKELLPNRLRHHPCLSFQAKVFNRFYDQGARGSSRRTGPLLPPGPCSLTADP